MSLDVHLALMLIGLHFNHNMHKLLVIALFSLLFQVLIAQSGVKPEDIKLVPQVTCDQSPHESLVDNPH